MFAEEGVCNLFNVDSLLPRGSCAMFVLYVEKAEDAKRWFIEKGKPDIRYLNGL